MRRSFLGFLVLIHLGFLCFALSKHSYLIPDSYDYLQQANNIRYQQSLYARGDHKYYNPDYQTKRPPAYALFILTLKQRPFWILVMQNLMSIAALFILYQWLIGQGYNEPQVTTFLTIALLFQSNQLIYANSIISETIFQFTILLAIFLIRDQSKVISTMRLFFSVILFCVSVFIKPVMLFFWIPLGIMLIRQAMMSKRIIPLFMILMMPLCIYVFSANNHRHTGYHHFSSISTVNLKDYNTRFLLHKLRGVEQGNQVISTIDSIAQQFQTYAERQRYIEDTCTTIIRLNWVSYAKIHVLGMVAMMLDPGRFDYQQFFKLPFLQEGLMGRLIRSDIDEALGLIKNQPTGLLLLLLINLSGNLALMFLSALGVWAEIKNIKIHWFTWLSIAYFIVLTGPVGTARYRSIIWPLLLIVAARGLNFLLDKKRKASTTY